MTNHPTSEDFDKACTLLATWQELAKARRLPEFVSALVNNELSDSKEFTTEERVCDCCCHMQPKGIRKFWNKERERVICEGCWAEAQNSATVQELFLAQVKVMA